MERIYTSNAVTIDTETTGLGPDAEIVEISVVDAEYGLSLFDSLIKPSKSIPTEASAIHGIFDKHVANSPTFPEVLEQLTNVIGQRDVIIYNADYDTRLIFQTLCIYNRQLSTTQMYFANKLEQQVKDSVCAMLWYAEFYGDWNDYHENFKWQSLTNACAQQNVDVSDLSAHRALADCEMTRRLIHAVNAKLDSVA